MRVTVVLSSMGLAVTHAYGLTVNKRQQVKRARVGWTNTVTWYWTVIRGLTLHLWSTVGAHFPRWADSGHHGDRDGSHFEGNHSPLPFSNSPTYLFSWASSLPLQKPEGGFNKEECWITYDASPARYATDVVQNTIFIAVLTWCLLKLNGPAHQSRIAPLT